MFPYRPFYAFIRLGYDFHLCVVVKTKSETIKDLFQLLKGVNLCSILKETHKTTLAHFGRVGMLIRRTHFQKYFNLVSHCKSLALMNHISLVYDSSISTSISNALGPTDGKRRIKTVVAQAYSNS